MKFGKRIRSEAVEQWNEQYVDYKGLKHLLKALVAKGSDPAEEEQFTASILAEIDKVDRFFISKESELYAEFRSLCQKVTQTPLEPAWEKAQSAKGINGHLHLDKLVSALEGTDAGQIIQALLHFSAKVDNMRKFVMINTLAVVKITKKHDKQEGVTKQLQWEMVNTVHKKHFYNSPHFSALITDVEVLASEIMFRTTKLKPLPENYSCPICLGILCNPVVLSCGHRFCMKCVSAASYFCQTSCPVCRKDQILDLETIKVDTLLSSFLDRYFPEGQSGVKQCKACAARNANPQVPRQRFPCEECNLQLLDSLEEMQVAALSQRHKAAEQRRLNGSQGTVQEEGGKDVPSSTGIKREMIPEDEDQGMEVRPRLKRRSVGQGGKQALGGRPELDSDAHAAPIVLNAATLRKHFNLPLNDAAKKLGVCATAIKKVCRKMGIKQWPHRKLKAVEKRLALLQAEHRYSTEEGLMAQYKAEIKDLEEKRNNLLQGLDCDISGVTEAVDPDENEQGNSSSTSKTSIKGATSLHAKDAPTKPVAVTSNKPLLAPLSDRDGKASGSALAPSSSLNDLQQDDTLELEDMCILPGDYKEPAGGAEQDVWEMLHKMMSDEAESLDLDDCKQMSSSSSRMVRTHADSSLAGSSSDHKLLQSALRPSSGNVSDGIHFDISECRLQIHMLQEEVLHLRQFSMALIKERGELATQLQRRDEELGQQGS
eukprot:766604-Hanusia_phi.AAC.1